MPHAASTLRTDPHQCGMLWSSSVGAQDAIDRLRGATSSRCAGGAAVWPTRRAARQPGKLPTIGFLGTATPSGMSRWTAAFAERLGGLAGSRGAPSPSSTLG